jgi:hypothetical protein
MNFSEIISSPVQIRLKDASEKCPKATQDIATNLSNRGKAIKTAMYGPLNPSEPNTEYWGKLAKEWDVDNTSAKKQLCGNCSLFIQTPSMKDCINKGVTGGDRQDEWEAIDSAGELGYCEAFDFKCASKRTCRAWVAGGPIVKEKSAKPLRDPKGGLTAAGREHFNRTEGSNLKPGVKGRADTPDKMRRKGSFLTRFFTNPSGPMKDEQGRPTRLALSAAAWGEPVPQNADDARELAAKGKRMLERYKNSKDKD